MAPSRTWSLVFIYDVTADRSSKNSKEYEAKFSAQIQTNPAELIG